MKKFLALLLAMIMVLSLVACGQTTAPADEGGEDAASAEPIEITFASIMSGNCLSNQTAEKFCEMVAERSEGRITVNFFPDCQLGSENECVQMLKTNEIQMCYFGCNFGAVMCPEYDATIVPYLFQSVDDARNFYLNDETMTPLIAAKIKEVANCSLIALNNRPVHMLSSVKKIETVDDLKGFKLRIPEISAWNIVWGGMGALPTVLSWSECYAGLQTGVIEGEENPLDTKYGNKIYEVADYMINTNHIYDTWHWCISNEFLDSLSAEDKDLILTCATEACEWGDAALEEEVAKEVAEVEATGVEFIDVDTKAFAEAALPYIKEYAQSTWAPETIEWVNAYLQSYGMDPLT